MIYKQRKGIEKRSPLARRLVESRRAAGLTLLEVSKVLGLDRVTFNALELGRRKLGGVEVLILAKLYGVDPWWLGGVRRPRGALSLFGRRAGR